MSRVYETYIWCPDCETEVPRNDLRPRYFETSKEKCYLKLWHVMCDRWGEAVLCGPIQLKRDQNLDYLEFEAIGGLI